MQEVTLGNLAIQGLQSADISDLCGLGWQDATDGWVRAGPLSSPEFRTREVPMPRLEQPGFLCGPGPSFFVGDAIFFSWAILVMCRSLFGAKRQVTAPRGEGKIGGMRGWGLAFQTVDSTVAFSLSSFPKCVPPHHHGDSRWHGAL